MKTELDSIHLLFTGDAVVDCEGIGSAQGTSEIEALYRDLVGKSPFIKQVIHNHVITLAGATATGLSYLDARTVKDGESILVAARFDDEYVRVGTGWDFQALRFARDSSKTLEKKRFLFWSLAYSAGG